MPRFETSVQELKYKVLREVAKGCFDGDLLERYASIPELIVPGPKPRMRCCIYKERAIVLERMRLALGGNPEIDNVIEVLKIACDECPLGGYEVTNRCRGCIARRCEKACRRGAIVFDEKTHAAVIDKEKCVQCGMCAKACQYSAIQNYLRPCVEACKVHAISMGADNEAVIDDAKCVQCGACVEQCPFGAIMDKSYMKEVIALLKQDEVTRGGPIYALVAPSIVAQSDEVSLGQVVTGIEKLGFTAVVEAALGADMVADNEAKELAEKGFLTSSCCPTFVSYIQKNFPALKDKISHNLSPMATLGKWLKEHRPGCVNVFIGPCIAKKKEIQLESVKPYIDFTLTFEELQAMIDARNIDLHSLKESPLDDASYYGRVFARSGGLCEAVAEALEEQGSDFVLKPMVADGLDNCRLALFKAKGANPDFNFLEGMACLGGCVGGPCSLYHEPRDKKQVDAHGRSSIHKTIREAIDDCK